MVSMTTAPEPRPAATLVVLRDSAHGLEVLLTKRAESLRFMGGATVFPGGAVSAGDLDPETRVPIDIDPGMAAERMHEESPQLAAALLACALREASEEVGLQGLAASDLVFAGRWVTPLGAPIRFDTCFFAVEAPPEWQPAIDVNEVADAYWSTPSAALTELAAGKLIMAPPTLEMLQQLDHHRDVAGALKAFAGGEEIGSGTILSMRLSPLVHVVLAPNPGAMTGPGTNTYIVGTGPTFVIDPAVDDPDYLATVSAAAGDITAILITHRHPDHVGGIASLVEHSGAPVRAFGSGSAGGVAVEELADGDVLTTGAATLEVIHAPGHASDHLCLLLRGTASLFAGDCILGEGTAVIAPPDGNMRDYLHSLERLRKLDIDRIYPGHFRPLEGGRAVIEGYIEHRRKREALILEAVKEPATLDQVVERAYVDTPAHLHPVARFSALAHLEMLEAEGRVQRRSDRWSQ